MCLVLNELSISDYFHVHSCLYRPTSVGRALAFTRNSAGLLLEIVPLLLAFLTAGALEIYNDDGD